MTSTSTHEHADPQICRQCKGLCCQGHPGLWVSPERFLKSFNLPRPGDPAELLLKIPKHNLTLRDIDGVPVPAPQRQDDGCIFLCHDGCQLSAAQRPCQCLALIPSLDTLINDEIHCQLLPEGSSAAARKEWRRFWQNTTFTR